MKLYSRLEMQKLILAKEDWALQQTKHNVTTRLTPWVHKIWCTLQHFCPSGASNYDILTMSKFSEI